ncbi:spastin-like [Actinia tenebrosa]|uniref:Spastin n=1 Tax=Actinia tenebrosa TaxID=6105 RepID=A0A6P8HCI7_ACTTE|nr:spastin-like [Actinia tenebrosa]
MSEHDLGGVFLAVYKWLLGCVSWLYCGLFLVFGTFVWHKFSGRRLRQRPNREMASKASSKTPAKADESLQNLPSPVRDVRVHHNNAYACIAKALEVDENKGSTLQTKKRVVDLYRRGIKELEDALAIDLTGKGEDWDKARRLQDKMETTHESARDRMDELVAHLLSADMMDDPSPSTRRPQTAPSSVKTTVIKKTRRNKAVNPNSNNDNSNARSSSSGTSITSSSSNSSELSSTSNARIRTTAGGPAAQRKYNSQPYRAPRARARSAADHTKQSRITEQKKKISYLKGIESKLANIIMDEILESGPTVRFDDIAGVDVAKKALREIVILPSLRPELFTGLRAPARGLLLFGPPGNGKTMLAKAVASEAQATFFNISAATLTSKWVGEGEKLVRALFAVARELQPSIIFIDEIDSLLTERREGEQEHSRRLKTELLVSFDGVIGDPDERILVMGATNRPQELDDAALRRLVKRVYVPLPDRETRKILLSKLLAKHQNPLSSYELDRLAAMTEGYSGSDLTALAKEAALEPIRGLKPDDLSSMDVREVRNITFQDFQHSLRTIRVSVSPESIRSYEQWNATYGCNA